MTTAPNFGHRLTQQDYEKKCSELWGVNYSSNSEEERETAEFNLLIDYKLGTSVPQETRTALLKARASARRKIIPNIVVGFIKPGTDPTTEVLLQAAKEFDKVLPREQVAQMTDYSVAELEQLLGPRSSRA